MAEPRDPWSSETFELSGTHPLVTPGASAVERYMLREQLGRGGIGEVHSVLDTRLEREVALKSSLVKDPRELLHFWHEARVTALLDHPNIVPVYDAGQLPDDRPFFIMKRIQGDNLGDVVLGGGLPTLRERLEVFRKVCDAVAYAHANGWMHRDLKPENIMLGAFGEVLVVDWGLAWPLEQVGAPVAGTPRYMAPEQAAGKPHDQRADVFGLGGVLWFLLAREVPWPNASDAMAIVEALRRDEVFVPTLRATVPRELLAIIRKALAASPSDRYPDVPALQQDLLAYLDERRVGAASYSVGQRLGKWMNRHRNRLFAGAVGMLALSALLGAVGLVTGAAVVRSALEARRSAVRATEAEAETRRQLVDALISSASAHIAGERYASAEDALRTAEERVVGERPAALDWAWTDLSSRGTWPVWSRSDLGEVVDLTFEDDHLVVFFADGRWAMHRLVDGSVARSGAVEGEPLAVVDGGFLVQRGTDVVLLDRSGTEVRRGNGASTLRVHEVWVEGGRAFVTRFERGNFRTAVWDLETLTRVDLPREVARGSLHAVSPGGKHVLFGASMDETQPARVFSFDRGLREGRRFTGRAALGGDAVFQVLPEGIDRWSLDGSRLEWTTPARAETDGVVAQDTVFLRNEKGEVQVLDAATGEGRGLLLGFNRRSERLRASGGWVAQAGARGLAVWAAPATSRTYRGAQGAMHPGGELGLVVARGGVELVHAPTARRLARFETGPAATLSWSPDGRRAILGGPRKAFVLDLFSGALEELPGGGNAVSWTADRLVLAGQEVVSLDPDTLEPRARMALDGTMWRALAGEGGVMLSTNTRPDDAVAVWVPDGKTPRVLRGGGSEDVLGFGLTRLSDGRWAFGRQDGQVVVRTADHAPDSIWSWQASPVLDVQQDPSGSVVAVTFDGRIHVVDLEGEPVYGWSYGEDMLLGLETFPGGVVTMGRTTRWIDKVSGLPPEGEERIRRARAWTKLRNPTPEEAVSAALVSGEGLLQALDGRTDIAAQLLRVYAVD